MIKICKACGKEFETNNPQKLYCNRDHYFPCPVCGKPVLKTDRDFTRPHKCCSSKCTHELRKSKFKPRKCIFCGEEFIPSEGSQVVCNNKHWEKCEICGKEFERTISNYHDGVTTCSFECTQEKLRRHSLEKYGVEYPMQCREVQTNFHNAMVKKYGVPHALQIPEKRAKQQNTTFEHFGIRLACLLPQCVNTESGAISKINKRLAEKLKAIGLDVELEHRLERQVFDFYVPDQQLLIERDPTYTHSIVENHWGAALDKFYHRDKSTLAIRNGYRCIHIFDWDDENKIVESLKPKTVIYARNCKLSAISVQTAYNFLTAYHFQGGCKGVLLALGLYYNDELVEVMTFGKSRYDKSYKYELLRLCTKFEYRVIGGAQKLMTHAIKILESRSILSYCDKSKFTGNVYNQLGMKKIRTSPPAKVWSKSIHRITDNLLRQRGYDQLFGTHYGKGTSNEQLMIENGWLPVYDCGQQVFALADHNQY